ncbi:MAG: ABC transporter substrate-binding protein [Nitrospiraceae bacterium]
MRLISRRHWLRWMALGSGAVVLGQFRGAGMSSAWASSDMGDHAVGHTAGPRPDGRPITIGIIDPLTGPYSTSSVHDVHGAHVAVDRFNRQGGVLGRPVQLLEADDTGRPDTAAAAATRFIEQDRVDVLMGTFTGACARAVGEVAQAGQRLFMVTGSHDPELTGAQCRPNTFVFMPNAMMLAQAVAPALAKEYGARWFMITADTADSRSAESAMTDACRAVGGEVIGRATVPFGATDFSEALAAAKAAAPQAIVLNVYGWDLVHALHGYAAAELAKAKIGLGGMIAGEQIGRPLGYAHNAGIWGLIWDPKIDTEGSRRFVAAVVEKYNHTPTSRCYLGYAAMTQILEAIQRAGTTDATALRAALEGHSFDGLKVGRSSFRAADHQHVQDVLVGKAYGKELGLGHYRILDTASAEKTGVLSVPQRCRL